MPSTRWRNVAAAWITSPPTTMAVRDATVGPLSGTIEVSCGAISTSSTGTPNCSATSCGKDADVTLCRELDRCDAGQLDLATPRETGPVPGEGKANASRCLFTRGP